LSQVRNETVEIEGILVFSRNPRVVELRLINENLIHHVVYAERMRFLSVTLTFQLAVEVVCIIKRLTYLNNENSKEPRLNIGTANGLNCQYLNLLKIRDPGICLVGILGFSYRALTA